MFLFDWTERIQNNRLKSKFYDAINLNAEIGANFRCELPSSIPKTQNIVKKDRTISGDKNNWAEREIPQSV